MSLFEHMGSAGAFVMPLPDGKTARMVVAAGPLADVRDMLAEMEEKIHAKCQCGGWANAGREVLERAGWTEIIEGRWLCPTCPKMEER